VTHPVCVGGVALRCLLIALAALGIASPAAAAPPADFTWEPEHPVVGRTAVFTAVQDPAIVAYRWDLDGNGRYDDGADRSGPQVPRTFQSVRTYTVGLVTVDDQGNLSERRQEVTVVAPDGPGPDDPPDASFVFFPAAPIAGEPITFVSTSTDPDSGVPAAALRWDLNGDGVFDDAEGPTATTSYALPGTYTISLRIATNAVDIASLVLNVGTPAVPGTSVGQRGLSLLSPFPVVRIAGRVSRRGARIRRLTVDAPPGTVVGVSCGGRGCPFRSVHKTISSRPLAGRALPASRLLRVRRLEGRLLRPGSMLRLFVTRAGTVGKYTRFRIRRGRPPVRRDMCLVPGNGRPLACPSR
jgi:PKD repeat protein